MEIPIEGVKLQELKINKDERGEFIELLRKDQEILGEIEQISISTTNPGVIKAFHMHNLQYDVWYLVEGKIIVGLHDQRKDSKTYGVKHKMVVEKNDSERFILIIPPGVAHGYKVVGDKPLTMLYAMDKCYNYTEPDEIRIPHDDPEIEFDWNE